MSNKERPSKFTQYRYLRWPWDNRLAQLAFLVNVDHDENEIEFTVAICNSADNFDHKAAHKILNARMKSKSKKCRFVIDYDRKHTLMQNIFDYLFIEYENFRGMAKLKVNSGKKLTKTEKDRLDFLRLVVQHGLNISYCWLKHYNQKIGNNWLLSNYYGIKHNWLQYPIPHVIYMPYTMNKLSLTAYKRIAMDCYFD